ncbi:protocadherin-16-like [Geospiza fortis]|uniref:Protocadherin-16-like n=1 Tax=Geospiza fortis TaxID=48883 RepID=A0A8N5F614_GEOFO|nr:protocadherin-16-like [Geospiza fortis]
MKRRGGRRQRALLWAVLLAAWEAAWGQLRYSVPEEMPKGSFVGDVAKDLGLQLTALKDRDAHVFDTGRTRYFFLDLQNGHLSMMEQVDREEICAAVAKCVLNFEILVKGPMNIYKGEVEIIDINDNPPSFPERRNVLEISENTAPGARFPLERAHDPDIGVNSLQNYECSESSYFTLDVKTGDDGVKYPELLLVKSLDREQKAAHHLILTATDNGSPVKSGSTTIEIIVLDGNDNAPEFTQSVYRVTVKEDLAVGSRVLQVTATDRDEGPNAEVKYSFFQIPEKFDETFKVDPESGEIVVTENLNFEEHEFYELVVQARDAGGLSSHSKVLIKVVDVNNYVPEIVVMSVFTPVPEDTPVGTVIAIFSVQDRDSGVNGEVQCSISDSHPFRLEKSFDNYYRVVTAELLDREQVSEYNVTVRAADGGSPALQSSAVLALRVLDVNDNAPLFLEERYSARLAENNAAGALVLTVRATDADWGQNARVRYRLAEGRVRGAPLSSYVSVQAETGALYALRSLDYEQLLLALRLRRCHRQHLLPPDSGALRGVPVSHFVGIDGVRAFLHSYSHDVSLTADSRKSHLRFSAASCCDTLPVRPPDEASGDLVPSGDQVTESGWQVASQSLGFRLRLSINDHCSKLALGESLCWPRLGLSADQLPARKLQVATAGKKQQQYFTVNEENGNLYVNERLDREEMCGESATCSVSFEVLVHNPLNIFHVEVDIQDMNDNAPHFLRENFQLEINELTSPGARFYLGTAEDADVGSNSLQGYELEANKYFAVEVKESQEGSKFAELVLRHSLDREREDSLSLVLTALDGGDPPRTGTAQLRINVTDANDNPPVFAQDRYRVSLREDTPPGSTVLNIFASDADAGTNARITYGFGEMPAKALQKFMVDGERGMITLQEALDFEDTRTFSLAVEARDGGGLVAHCKVEVEVLDVNDNAPEVTLTSVSSPVPEDAPAGTVVALLKVRDRDSGENGQVSCELSGEAPLSIVASSGGSYKVVTSGALDREQASEQRVTVVARDRGRPALWSSRELVLEVSDVNDNAPVFEEAAYSAYVAENNAAGALVLRVQARDADAGANGRVSYWLAGGSAGAADNNFVPQMIPLSRSGHNLAGRRLRAPLLTERSERKLGALPAAPPAADRITRSIALCPNLRSPIVPAVLVHSGARWRHRQLRTVQELRALSGSGIGSAVLRCRRFRGRDVRGGEALGPAAASSALGRAAGGLGGGGLLLRASDGGDPARTGTARIRVTVLDANDNAPVFSQAEYTVRVPEDVPVGSVLVTVTATDADEGLNGQVKYSLHKISDRASEHFNLDSETGEITVKDDLDFEEISSHELEVQAHDGGELSDTAKVVITVTDVNDNVPKISVRSALKDISEDAQPGTVVALLHVQDRDSGANGHVRCSIDKDVPFRLEKSYEDYYRVVTARELDREQVSEYNVTVRAADGGSPALQSSAVLALRVLDVNDNAPLFLEERYSARLAENNAAGALVLTVRATDADWGQNARVRYRGCDPLPARPPPDEPAPLLGDDDPTGALPADSASVPRAAGRLRYAIPEELARGSLVGPLARDLGLSADQLPARKLQVATAGKKQLKYFMVNEENGNLYVNERLDREEMCGESATCSVSFEALVHNPLNIFRVEVAIEDVNDNSPVFSKAALELEITELTVPGTRFPLEMARDADVGSNSQLTYQLASNPSFSLILDENPGGKKQPALVLEKALDREKQSSFELVLMAVDGGDPARSGTVEVRINVTDANDNQPVFSQRLYEARAAENLPAWSLVLQVVATDADAGSNGRVFYSFGNVPDAIRRLFAVDIDSGEVRLVGPLDFEEKNKYIFGLEARDGGGLTDHCEVHIDITDENDNPPEISILSLSSPVPEDAPEGTVVALLKVRDRDSGENGQVSCELSGEAPLSIVASSGGSYKVVTSGALDREQASEQRVTVVARDRGRPALWSSRELVLEVSDVNDNAPVFEEAAYSAYVAENNAAGALVLRVQARDADAGANGRVSYWLAGGSAGAAD